MKLDRMVSSAARIVRPPAEPADFPEFGRPVLSRSPLLERLRKFRPVDLTFIAAGVPILLLAPLCEHLVSTPDDLRDALAPGFSTRGVFLPDGVQPYEGGLSGIAPGNVPGRDEGVVTELTSSNPISLIKPFADGDEAPAKTPAKPEAKRPATSEGWKDALETAAKGGATKVARHSPLPLPGGKLAGKLNALFFSGGQSGSALHLAPPPSSKELFASPRILSNLSRIAVAPDYKGEASRGLASGTGWLPPAGGKAPASALPASSTGGGYLEPRSAGFGGAGIPAAGWRPDFDGNGKSPGVNAGALENKSISIQQKEDLAFERRKLEMQKAIDLKYAKKTYDQVERKKMLEQMAAQTAQQALLKVIDGVFGMAQKKDDKKQDGSGGGGGQSGGGRQQQAAAPEAQGQPVPDESGKIEGFDGQQSSPKRVKYDQQSRKAYGPNGRYVVLDENGKPREVSEEQQAAMEREGIDPGTARLDSQTGDIKGQDGTKVSKGGDVQPPPQSEATQP